jgi:heme-degrading monooxygenase HmoA
MFSVIFEVNRKPERSNDYLEFAKQLKPILEKIDGFVDNERFESKRRKGWLLSHSTWRDEKSVIRWRTEGEHHHVQEKGRFEIFQDYRLRVGEVVSDTAPPPEAPIRELRFDETEVGQAKYATFTEMRLKAKAALGSDTDRILAHLGLDLGLEGLVEHDIYESIYTPGKMAVVAAWKNAEAAKSWTPTSFEAVQDLRHRIVRVIRDYGMFDRREAPQFYPDVQTAANRSHLSHP